MVAFAGALSCEGSAYDIDQLGGPGGSASTGGAGSSEVSGSAGGGGGGVASTGGGSAGRGGGSALGGGSHSGGGVAAGGGLGSGGGVATGGGGHAGGVGGGGVGGGGAGGGPATVLPAGWLYTSGSKLYVSDGEGAGSVWMGRGVNMDDIFLCGGNSSLGATDIANSVKALKTMANVVVNDWKANFIRVSLAMNSGYSETSWLDGSGKTTPYANAMIDFIKTLAGHPGVYVLVTLRSDSTMEMSYGDNEATFVPTSSTAAVYKALVDSFSSCPIAGQCANFQSPERILFGVTNEPGFYNHSKVPEVLTPAVKAIRDEEDFIQSPHHIVAVQGDEFSSVIDYYSVHRVAYDNVVYELHFYPQAWGRTTSAPIMYTYTYPYVEDVPEGGVPGAIPIPVIVGEYGDVDTAALLRDLETKQIPSLAWDFNGYSNCYPNVVNPSHNYDATTFTPTSYGSIVRGYLQDPASVK